MTSFEFKVFVIIGTFGHLLDTKKIDKLFLNDKHYSENLIAKGLIDIVKQSGKEWYYLTPRGNLILNSVTEFMKFVN